MQEDCHLQMAKRFQVLSLVGGVRRLFAGNGYVHPQRRCGVVWWRLTIRSVKRHGFFPVRAQQASQRLACQALVARRRRMVVVGLDPGGARAFGWAIVTGSFSAPLFLEGGVCNGARSAIAEVERHLPGQPAGVGIDAPLFWSPLGDRAADKHVRRLVCQSGGHAGTVSHVNSLRGACLVEGAIASQLVNQRWPTAAITEAHPKALLAVSAEAREFSDLPCIQGPGDHIRDAAIAAMGALAMLEKQASWKDLADIEAEALFPLGVRVTYWFPR